LAQLLLHLGPILLIPFGQKDFGQILKELKAKFDETTAYKIDLTKKNFRIQQNYIKSNV
jgi:hypothetical protein